uniref:Aminopeptidase n=1 Tax=Sinocyclocheilus anshuiensis TaxID=1608454 RepID=A0A671SNZ9_9TELE
MGKGFYISKTVGIVGIVLAAGALATITALPVVYSQEKSKNNEVKSTDPTMAPSNEPWDQWRLPQTLSPKIYNITLWPRLQPDPTGLYIFTGLSSVVFRCVEKTNLILIHSNKLNMTKHPTLIGLGGKPAPTIESIVMHTKTQYMAIHLKEELTAGESYELYTEFLGELSDDLGGFYRSEYYENGIKKVVATTQMQATDARKAFPCFDEPAMKAVFHITLNHDPATVALSNGVVIDEVNITVDDTLVTRTTFAPTEVMSTYLLAFIVSDFIFIEQDIENLQIRIFARQEAINAGQGEYALSVTGPILKFFEKYYNVPYPLPKSDQIALPDFNAGAMENWGLITYRETALLYDEEISSNENKERIITVISHELAHQWFGNLVTVRWWNDLWLNEGFATYVEYLGADEAEPDWNIKDLIVLNDVHKVFAIDALASSHPLSSKEEEIQRPEQITEMFDTISYSKGASVLRMLSTFLTEKVFTQGLQTYLDHFKFNNTVYTDLWEHLQKAVDSSGTTLPKTVQEIMGRWILQMGFPVVTINTATGQITQEHFLLDPETEPDRPSEFKYVKKYFEEKNPKNFITKYLLLISIKAQFTRYETEDTTGLTMMMKTGNAYLMFSRLQDSIPVINRAQIIDDAFNLANFQSPLKWSTCLCLEYFIMSTQLSLNYHIISYLQTYVGNQVKNLFDYFTRLTNWEDVPPGHTDQYNQVNALTVACSTGLEACMTLVKTWFQQWMENPNVNPIKANLRSAVYCSAIAAGGEKEWNFAWEMFEKATVASEKDKLRAAMACATEPWLLNRYLKYTLDPEKIRKQDATSTIISIASNVVGQPLAWDFVRANWEYIFNQYGGGSFSFSNLINGVTNRFSTEFELQQVCDLPQDCFIYFFDCHLVQQKLIFECLIYVPVLKTQLIQFRDDYAHIGFGSGTLAIQQSIERTTANIKWVEKNQKAVLEWFKNPS